jgi:hypothetical protein
MRPAQRLQSFRLISRKRYVGGKLCFLDQNSRAAAQRASEIFRRFPVVPRPSAQLGLARWSLMGVPAPRSELQSAAVLDFASCCSRPHRGITFFPPVFASRDVSECRNRPSNEANDFIAMSLHPAPFFAPKHVFMSSGPASSLPRRGGFGAPTRPGRALRRRPLRGGKEGVRLGLTITAWPDNHGTDEEIY